MKLLHQLLKHNSDIALADRIVPRRNIRLPDDIQAGFQAVHIAHSTAQARSDLCVVGNVELTATTITQRIKLFFIETCLNLQSIETTAV